MDKDVTVKLSIIKTIYQAMLPTFYKLNSILEDVVSKTVLVTEVERATLLEFCSCASALKLLFENYLEKSVEEEISIPRVEYTTILSMSKTVEAASRSVFSNFSLLEH